MRRAPDDELLEVIAETNDQRRRVGQSLLGLHRALLFGRARGRAFFDSVRLWAPGAATTFASLAERLRRLPPPGHDGRLRRWLAPLLLGLATDLERGEHGLEPFLRDLERSFPELTTLMREEARSPRIADLELARALAGLCGALARDDRASAVRRLREGSASLLGPPV